MFGEKATLPCDVSTGDSVHQFDAVNKAMMEAFDAVSCKITNIENAHNRQQKDYNMIFRNHILQLQRQKKVKIKIVVEFDGNPDSAFYKSFVMRCKV